MNCHHDKTDSSEKVVFNKNEPTQSLLSNEIRVHDRPVLITHWNAIEGEYICLVKFNLSDGCGKDIAGDLTFAKDCNCNFICLCCKCNTIKVAIPGRYKLFKKGVLNNAQVSYKYISSRFC